MNDGKMKNMEQFYWLQFYKYEKCKIKQLGVILLGYPSYMTQTS